MDGLRDMAKTGEGPWQLRVDSVKLRFEKIEVSPLVSFKHRDL